MAKEQIQHSCDIQLKLDELEVQVASMKVYIAALEMAVEFYKSALEASRGVNKIYDKETNAY